MSAQAAHQLQPKQKTMKTNTLIILAATIGLSGASYAEEGKKERPHRKLPPELIAKFDKDGDGKLDEAERKAAREGREEMMAERRKEMLAKFDKDGDGELNDDEKAAMREEMKRKALEKFDKDGDGELSEEERAEMRKAMGDRPGGPKGQRERGKGPRPEGNRERGPQAEEAPGAGE